MIDTIETVETAETPAQLRRRPANFTQRRVAFYDTRSRTLALETSRVVTLTLDSERASDLLAFVAKLPAAERPRVVFLCGGDSAATTPETAWWKEPVACGWTLSGWHNAADRRTGVYERDGVTVDLRMAAAWFGTSAAALDPEMCLSAWRVLLRQLRGAFGSGVALMTTPAMTGMRLFEARMPYAQPVTTLPEALRDHLYDISTQGRRELFPQYTRTISDVYELDARWMYAACLHHLPVGPVVQDGRNEYAGEVPGFYLVKARVPAGWDHIGLLPDYSTYGGPKPIAYPRRPRRTFWSWATGAELALALNPGQGRPGWPIEIHQRILWPETHKRPDIAKEWRRDLVTLRQLAQFGALARRPDADLLTGALRHLLIDPIGRWHSREQVEYGFAPSVDLMPPGAIPHLEGGMVQWERYVPWSGDQLRYAQPQLSGMVWGRVRRRLARKALELPFWSIVALRTDGIWTTANPDEWRYEDEGADPGAWRIKSALINEPTFWPRDEDQLIDLMRRARGGEEE